MSENNLFEIATAEVKLPGHAERQQLPRGIIVPFGAFKSRGKPCPFFSVVPESNVSIEFSQFDGLQ
jgi:hypothetical protein